MKKKEHAVQKENNVILVLGGAGYIGSNMVKHLLSKGYRPIVFDNFSTGHRALVPAEVPVVEGDIDDIQRLEEVFGQYQISVVMHFAASSLVGESMANPLKYYRNNVGTFLNILSVMVKAGVDRLIFSSTAAVYGQPEASPITEKQRPNPINPYGKSKLMMEQIMEDVARGGNVRFVSLRYFNAAGASDDGEAGERHDPETHLIPRLLRALKNNEEVVIYGEDYSTPDGTCVRDYVHVADLCDAHEKAARYLLNDGESVALNLGTGRGASVQEVIQMAERITGKRARTQKGPRRPGDPGVLVASFEKAKQVLGWTPQRNLENIVKTAWRWHEQET